MTVVGYTCASLQAVQKAGVFALPSATGGESWGSAASIRSICARRASAPANAASWSSKASIRSTIADSERARAAAKMAMTFRKAALAFIDGHKDGWTAHYTRQWRDHFETFVFPEIGALPMQAVNNTDVVLRVLEPIWKTRTVTAWNIRARIEMIINWAKFQ